MYKLILFIAFVSGLSWSVQAQSYTDNFNKYWWYRYKLVNDFMKIGDQCGESIPMQERHAWPGHIKDTVCHGEWGDATIWLGQYMAVLATEYKLLNQNKLSTSRTVYEIYYALKAFDRLDLTAEAHCRDFTATQACQNINPITGSGQPYTDDFNGFFIRDDVPYQFVQNNLQHFNRPKAVFPIYGESSAVESRMDGHIRQADETFHDWSDMYPNTPHYPTEMSQDQVVDIYIGLSLITYLLDGWESYNGENLKTLAKEALLRVSVYVSLPAGQFVIHNPLNLNCVYGISPENYNTSVGNCSTGGAIIFPCAPALTLGLRRVNAGWNFSQNAQVTNIQMQSAAFESLYQLMKYATFCSNELYFVTGFTTVAKSWTLTSLFNWNVSRTAIIRQSTICDFRWPHFPLIYRLFHGGAMFNPEAFPYNQMSYEDLLDLAPSCAIDRRDNSNYEWSSCSRLREPHKRGPASPSEANGLDYMLLFNLYLLNEGHNYATFYYNPYYAEDFNTSFPFQGVIGSIGNPLTLNFFEYLSSSSHIASNGDVTFRAAKEIVLKPGFNADNGCKFIAYIDDYGAECVNDSECNRQSIHIPDSGVVFTGNSELFGRGFTDFVIPTDTISDYDPTPEEWEQDSIAGYDALVNSDDSASINYYLDLIQRMADDSIQEMSGNMEINNSIFHVFPNPSTGLIAIESPGKDKIYAVQLWDMLGRAVVSRRYNGVNKVILDLSHFAKGNYVLRTRTFSRVHNTKITLR